MKDQIDLQKLPRHIAIIMDGNGRWAKKQGAMRVFGHRNAIKAVREATEGCAELGVKYLTLYAFSTENWARPELEVKALMELLMDTLHSELPTLLKNNVKLDTIGNTDSLPSSARVALLDGIQKTKHNTGLNLILALGYSGKWDILQATKHIVEDIKQGDLSPNMIDENTFSHYLSTGNRPEVDLMLRTGGDHRISNFLLWQLAYAELYFYEDILWPDFRRENLYEAIVAFQNRERRFGKTSEQVSS